MKLYYLALLFLILLPLKFRIVWVDYGPRFYYTPLFSGLWIRTAVYIQDSPSKEAPLPQISTVVFRWNKWVYSTVGKTYYWDMNTRTETRIIRVTKLDPDKYK